MSRSTTLPLVLLALLAGIPLASGCSGCDKPADNTVDAAPATSATPASSSATVVAAEGGAPEGGATADEPGQWGGRRGVASAFFQSARALEPALTAEVKKKIDDAETLDPPPTGSSVKDAAKELHNELVAGIKAGKIESAKLEPKYAAIEKIASAEHDKEIAALNGLYAALDATQRKAVVAAMRTRQSKRDERLERMKGGMLDAGGPDGGRPSMGKMRIDRLTRGLELDADQQKKVDALVPANGRDDTRTADIHAHMKKRTAALLAAFEKDGFDAKKADAFDVKKSRAALEDETKLLTQILPILKPGQREKLAAKMERGPMGPSPHLPKRGGMGHHPLLEPGDDDFGP